MFIARTDAEPETPMLWPPEVKSCLMNPRVSRRKEILKIKAEINAKKQETIAKIYKTKSCFFEKVNKIDKPLGRLIKKQREKN